MDRRRTLRSSTRAANVALASEIVWGVVASGESGPQWYLDATPFVFRGALDRLVGGRGRSWGAPGNRFLATGDRAGFWEVLDVAPERRSLTLEARVRAPGRVRLVTTVTPTGAGSEITQTISFAPRGLSGTAYLLADLPARGAVAELVMLHLLTVLRKLVEADDRSARASAAEA